MSKTYWLTYEQIIKLITYLQKYKTMDKYLNLLG